MAMGCSLREQSKSCLAINWCTYSSMIICIGTHDQQIDGSTHWRCCQVIGGEYLHSYWTPFRSVTDRDAARLLVLNRPISDRDMSARLSHDNETITGTAHVVPASAAAQFPRHPFSIP